MFLLFLELGRFEEEGKGWTTEMEHKEKFAPGELLGRRTKIKLGNGDQQRRRRGKNKTKVVLVFYCGIFMFYKMFSQLEWHFCGGLVGR